MKDYIRWQDYYRPGDISRVEIKNNTIIILNATEEQKKKVLAIFQPPDHQTKN